MALPRVRILFVDGESGSSAPSDLEWGLIGTGVAVASTFALLTPYSVTKLDGLTTLGITEINNPTIYKAVKEFYTEGRDGTKLWVYGVADTVTLTQMVDKDSVHVKAVAAKSNYAVRAFMVTKKDAVAYTPTILNGLDADVATAKTKAQLMGEWLAENKYSPVWFVLPGRHFTDAGSLLDQFTDTSNRVCILIGDTVSGSKDAAVGLVLGRKSRDPLRRKLMRVMTGRVPVDSMYVGSTSVGEYDPTTLDGKGYISFRMHQGKAGYYFTNDWMCTKKTSDFAVLPRRCVIDEAYRLCYKKVVDILGDEFDVTSEGYIPHALIKSIQNDLADYIEVGLGENVAKDPDNAKDTGVKVYIDPKQNLITAGGFDMELGIKPFGYPDYVNVNLRYTTQTV